MKVRVKDLGAIKEATIDLTKKLNVFCGPNGTGKTYIAYLLYAITTLRNKSLGLVLDDVVVKKLTEENRAILSLNFDSIWTYNSDELERMKANLWNVFAVPEDKAADFFSKTELDTFENKEIFISRIKTLEFSGPLKIFNYTFKIKKNKNDETVLIEVPDDTIKNSDFVRVVEMVLLSRIYSVFAFYPIVSSTIFPVERNSIYTFSNELSIRKNEALDHIQAISNKKDFNLIDLFFKRNTRYPQPIRDCLEVAEDLENIQKRKSSFFDFALELERELLKGEVKITKEGSVEFISEKARKVKLSFHQSSSIVKTLASLVIYLKHIAEVNDLVIIDEPELNLHPNNQVVLTRIFARLIKSGLRLVISTHSDYIIRELNNLIMISQDNDEIKSLVDRFHYKKEEYINVTDIAAYMFNYKNQSARQIEVKEIKIDEFGFEVSTLDETIIDLNKVSDELYYTLKYGKAE